MINTCWNQLRNESILISGTYFNIIRCSFKSYCAVSFCIVLTLRIDDCNFIFFIRVGRIQSFYILNNFYALLINLIIGIRYDINAGFILLDRALGFYRIFFKNITVASCLITTRLRDSILTDRNILETLYTIRKISPTKRNRSKVIRSCDRK